MVFKLFLSFIMLASIRVGYGADMAQQESFNLQPTICVVDKDNDYCNTVVTINWLGAKHIKRCLKVNDELVECWENVSSFILEVPIESSKNMAFTLLSETDERLYQQTLFVHKKKKKYRRRIISDWGIF